MMDMVSYMISSAFDFSVALRQILSAFCERQFTHFFFEELSRVTNRMTSYTYALFQLFLKQNMRFCFAFIVELTVNYFHSEKVTKL